MRGTIIAFIKGGSNRFSDRYQRSLCGGTDEKVIDHGQRPSSGRFGDAGAGRFGAYREDQGGDDVPVHGTIRGGGIAVGSVCFLFYNQACDRSVRADIKRPRSAGRAYVPVTGKSLF